MSYAKKVTYCWINHLPTGQSKSLRYKGIFKNIMALYDFLKKLDVFWRAIINRNKIVIFRFWLHYSYNLRPFSYLLDLKLHYSTNVLMFKIAK